MTLDFQLTHLHWNSEIHILHAFTCFISYMRHISLWNISLFETLIHVSKMAQLMFHSFWNISWWFKFKTCHETCSVTCLHTKHETCLNPNHVLLKHLSAMESSSCFISERCFILHVSVWNMFQFETWHFNWNIKTCVKHVSKSGTSFAYKNMKHVTSFYSV